MKPVLPPFQRGGGFGTLGSSFLEPPLPTPIPLTPATWGAWATLALLLIGVAWLCARLLRRHVQRQHRRLARRELIALSAAWRSAPPAQQRAALETLPRVLKGCALGSFERKRVAKLAGRAWLEFLRGTAPDAGFDGSTGDALIALCEQGAPAVTEAAVPALFAAAQRWVTRHHV
jgi:Domain of unknown function (DUF4381)